MEFDHWLLPCRTTDALGNTAQAENDFRVLQPWRMIDPNGNRTELAFDPLGLVVATAVRGKEKNGGWEGDSLDDPTTRMEYELFAWKEQQKPNFVHTFSREQHGPDNPRWQESFLYSDGFGRELQTKVQAEPGEAPKRAAQNLQLPILQVYLSGMKQTKNRSGSTQNPAGWAPGVLSTIIRASRSSSMNPFSAPPISMKMSQR